MGAKISHRKNKINMSGNIGDSAIEVEQAQPQKEKADQQTEDSSMAVGREEKSAFQQQSNEKGTNSGQSTEENDTLVSPQEEEMQEQPTAMDLEDLNQDREDSTGRNEVVLSGEKQSGNIVGIIEPHIGQSTQENQITLETRTNTIQETNLNTSETMDISGASKETGLRTTLSLMKIISTKKLTLKIMKVR